MIPDDYCCPICGAALIWVGESAEDKELACLNCGCYSDDDSLEEMQENDKQNNTL